MASALSLLGDGVDAAVLEALEGTGLRRGHGYLVQRLLLGPATATEIADDLGVSQQAVSKALRELIVLGHVEHAPDGVDRRRRPVRLTAKGREAVARARATRRTLDQRLRDALGDEELERLRSALLVALDAFGLMDRVARRAARPPGDELV